MSIFDELNMSLVEIRDAMPTLTRELIMPQLMEEVESDGKTISLCMAIVNGGRPFLKTALERRNDLSGRKDV